MTPHRVKVIAVLVLVAAYPLSAGILARSAVLTWTGIALIALACILFLAVFSAQLWDRHRAGKPRVVVVWSKWAADEYARLGWTLRPELAKPRNGAPSYFLQWLREGAETEWSQDCRVKVGKTVTISLTIVLPGFELSAE